MNIKQVVDKKKKEAFFCTASCPRMNKEGGGGEKKYIESTQVELGFSSGFKWGLVAFRNPRGWRYRGRHLAGVISQLVRLR